MGYADHVNDAKRGKRRGATNNGKRLAGLGNAKVSREERQWGDCDPAWIAAFVILLTNAGGAVRFGRSRDGAILSIGVYLDQDAVTLWLDKDGTTEEQMSELYEQLKERLGQ